jgi:hypothetical protein
MVKQFFAKSLRRALTLEKIERAKIEHSVKENKQTERKEPTMRKKF